MGNLPYLAFLVVMAGAAVLALTWFADVGGWPRLILALGIFASGMTYVMSDRDSP